MKNIHLVCNAHLDPVWLWAWDEGAAEAISTFQIAADFCEKYEGFVFNHNEAVLYEWVEEYAPELFSRISELVKLGKWHIMGGWYLQPDCNMPSGEGIVRQIITGRKYFLEKFGVTPSTAINFDPFGHSQGLVQILAKSGYDSYLISRPLENFPGGGIKNAAQSFTYNTPIPDVDFLWEGFDGSCVKVHRSFENYLSKRGMAADKVTRYIEQFPDKENGIVLWGIGNHGGGPSVTDMENIAKLIDIVPISIRHSTPEAYFELLNADSLKIHKNDLNPWAPGCYTTQIKIKQYYINLEENFFLTEKMASQAALAGLLPYPKEELDQAQKIMLFSQFHDILPGTVIKSATGDCINTMAHGLDILSKLRTKVFFAMCAGQHKAAENSIPVFIYNPHPYEINDIFTCEFNLADQHPQKPFIDIEVYCGEQKLASQLEKEESNMSSQWRKKIVFRATLLPSQMNRFDCKTVVRDEKPEIYQCFAFNNESMSVRINTTTGLIDEYSINGKPLLKPNSFLPLVLEDDDHSIGTFNVCYRDLVGCFSLMDENESADFSGVWAEKLAPVRVIEDGAVRTIVEAVLRYNNSNMAVRYIIPKVGTRIEIKILLMWVEKNKMLKLSVPTLLKKAEAYGQTMYGTYKFNNNGNEMAAQRFVFLKDDNDELAVINNSIYGFDAKDGELRLTLIRSPRYGCLVPRHNAHTLYNDRYIDKTDQGEFEYTFYLDGKAKGIDMTCQYLLQKPYALSFFPTNAHSLKPKCPSVIATNNENILITAIKLAENKSGYVIRLFNTSGSAQECRLTVLEESYNIYLNPFEIKSLLNGIEVSLTEIQQ